MEYNTTLQAYLVGGLEQPWLPKLSSSVAERAKLGPVLDPSDPAMASDFFPMNIGSVSTGGLLNLVAKMKVFDHEHERHQLVCLDGTTFYYSGLLSFGFTAYTIFRCQLDHQFPDIQVSAMKDTLVLEHKQATWDSLHSVIDICAGFGGLSQGFTAAGFDIAVSADMNPRMMELNQKINDAPQVVGDIGDTSNMYEIWKNSQGALVLTCGFSCQPYSKLGDEKSCADTRASCLSKTLALAYFLQLKILVLECVEPAGSDPFVKSELEHFQAVTGFTCSQTDLKLSDVWPCRRHRSWWVLSSPEIGPIGIESWGNLTNVPDVSHVIPSICPWSEEDEEDLALDSTESHEFGSHDETLGKYLPNGKKVAPCALHAWGNQLRGCPCGCRSFPLSAVRIANKGLHGCLVRSTAMKDGKSRIRHIHPNEAMGLNTMDPIIDFGTPARLVLSAVGQIAAPIQALWIFSFIELTLSQMRFGKSDFEPDAQIQAYRAWLLMRCRQVWPIEHEIIQDSKLLALMTFWNPYKFPVPSFRGFAS